jgi:hypothetical protein
VVPDFDEHPQRRNAAENRIADLRILLLESFSRDWRVTR